MVDIVANNVMATSTTPDLSTFMFKDESQYHPYCAIDWNNETSVENCWLGAFSLPSSLPPSIYPAHIRFEKLTLTLATLCVCV